MAASLRTLLDKPEEGEVKRIPTFMGEDGYQYLHRGTMCHHGCIDDGVANRYHNCACWCVPNLKVCRLKIEIWGAGGQGTGPRCRSMGYPGMSGEYKSRILCASTFTTCDGQYFDGTCWQFLIAWPRCCADCGGGCRGCCTTLCGINSFCMCAAGGCGGMNEGQCRECAFTCFIHARGCQHFPGNQCFHLNDAPGYNMASQSFPRDYAQRKAAMEAGCCYHLSVQSSVANMDGTDRNNCSFRWFNPYPAGINSTHGGFNMQFGNTECCCSCWDCFEHQITRRPGFWPMGTSWMFQGPVGSGGSTSYMGGDSVCRCGGPGTGGAVRFTLYPDTNALN